MDWGELVESLRPHGVERRPGEEENSDVVLAWAGSIECFEVACRFRSRIVGAAAAFRDEPRTSELGSLEGMEVVVVPRAAFLEACEADPALHAAAMREAVDEAMARGHAFHGFAHTLTKEHFPGTRAVVAPGPYVADEVEVWAIPVAIDAAEIRLRLPPRVGLIPLIEHGWLMFTRWTGFRPQIQQDGPRFDYTEVGLLLPALVGPSLAPRAYVSWLFPNSLMALYGGRELYGLPKMFGNVRVDDDRLLLLTRDSVPDGSDPTRPTLDVSIEALGRDRRARTRWRRLTPKLRMTHLWKRMGSDALAGQTTDAKRMPALHIAGWKRNFSTRARMTAPTERWRPRDFHVDGIASCAMRLNGFDPDSIEPFMVTRFDIRSPLSQALEPLNGLGVRYRCKMTLESGEPLLVDYLAPDVWLTHKERERLAWGPDVWERESLL